MKISDFISQVGKSGLARTNRYAVIMDLPNVVKGYYPEEVKKMLIFADSVQLPGLNLNTAQIRTFGEIREMPYELNYDPIQFNFLVDGDMIIKGMMDDWIKNVQQTTHNFNYYDDYICPQVKIWVQDLDDKTKYEVVLYEAYPKTIGSVQMGYDQKDIMKLNVTMMYKHWKSRIIFDNNTDGSITSPDIAEASTAQKPSLPQIQFEKTKVDIGSIDLGNPMGDIGGFGGGW